MRPLYKRYKDLKTRTETADVATSSQATPSLSPFQIATPAAERETESPEHQPTVSYAELRARLNGSSVAMNDAGPALAHLPVAEDTEQLEQSSPLSTVKLQDSLSGSLSKTSPGLYDSTVFVLLYIFL